MADADALQAAVTAFVRNAVDAMPDGGRLTVAVRAGQPGEGELTVRDTGPGMTGEVQARLFEPFFTTKTDGIGLGLVSARQVVEQHGGRVEVSSQTGAGTTVRVVLPASKQAGDDGRRTHPGR
jgi:signal transduction histidine kinase